MLIVARDSGKCIATSSANLDALAESGKRVQPLRERGSEILGSAAPDVQEWEALDNSREKAAALRQAGQGETGIEFTDVEEFELAFAHLHVPELV